MRPTTRAVFAALVVAVMLAVAGCAGPSANSTTADVDGTITTIAPEETPSNDSAGGGAEAAGEETEASGLSLVSFDATG